MSSELKNHNEPWLTSERCSCRRRSFAAWTRSAHGVYQLKEDVLTTRGNVRVGLVRNTPFDEPRPPTGETEFIRRPLCRRSLIVGACEPLVVVVAILEQTRNDVRRERRAQQAYVTCAAATEAPKKALKEGRPYREHPRRWIVVRRSTFPYLFNFPVDQRETNTQRHTHTRNL